MECGQLGIKVLVTPWKNSQGSLNETQSRSTWDEPDASPKQKGRKDDENRSNTLHVEASRDTCQTRTASHRLQNNNSLSKSKIVASFLLPMNFNVPEILLLPLEGTEMSDFIRHLRNIASEFTFRTWWILVLFLQCVCVWISTKNLIRNWICKYFLTKDVYTSVRSS